KALGRPPESIPTVGVSSNAKLAWLTSGEADDLADSNFEALERLIWSHLEQERGRVLLAGALARAGGVLDDLRAPVAAGLEALQAESQKELEALEARWRDLKTRLTDLQAHNAAWKTTLADALQDLAGAAKDDLSDGFAQLRDSADRRLGQEEFLDAPRRLIDRLQVDANAVVAGVVARLRERAAAVLNEFQRQTSLRL